MDDAEASRQKTGASPGFQDDVRREAAHFRQQPAVVEYQRPEFTGDGEGDVLPFAVRHEGQQILYPGLTGLHATVGAGTAFTAETDFFV